MLYFYYPDKTTSLEILTDGTNLNAAILNSFFENNIDTDIIVTYLQSSTTGIQQYVDVYNDVDMLTTNANQYNTSIQSDPIITGDAQDKLNNIFFNLIPSYPNSSFLWNQNSAYLSETFNTNISSFTLFNGMKMTEYILLGKDINLLASHSGVLQFNTTTKTMLYPALLLKNYNKDLDTFVNYSITFDDPLLGNFDFPVLENNLIKEETVLKQRGDIKNTAVATKKKIFTAKFYKYKGKLGQNFTSKIQPPI